jgi:hypothetical protein
VLERIAREEPVARIKVSATGKGQFKYIVK